MADCERGSLVELRQERAFTLIGRALGPDGVIPAVKLAEVVQAVAAQHAVARELGAERIRCVATAAIRRATNGAVLARLIHATCGGLQLEVLPDAEEARLAFIGAAWGAGAAGEPGLGVIDAGGGSSELVVGDPPNHVRWWISLPVGSGVVTERWLLADPPTGEQVDAALRAVRAVVAQAPPPPKVRRLVAVGGSATSLRLLAGSRLDAETLDRLLADARRQSAVSFARSFGVDVQRARLLAGGLVILRAVSEVFDVPLEIGRGGLREGILLDGN